MAEGKLISISVDIAGREYPLKVEEHEVEMVQTIVKDLNKKIRDFQRTYSSKDLQDCISMTLLTYVFEFEKVRKNGTLEGAQDDFDKVENLLDKLLS